MFEYNSPEEVYEAIQEAQMWTPSEEKTMQLKALRSLILTVTYGKQFKPGLFFDVNTYSPVMLHNRLIHWLSCHWVEYDDHNVFDVTKQVCLICGRTQSSMMAREYAYMEDIDPDFTKEELKDLRRYLANV